MNKLLLPFIITMIFTLPHRAAGQTTTKWYFMCQTYSMVGTTENVRHPYLTVLMAKDSAPNDIIAVALGDFYGYVSFYGVPIELNTPYRFTLLLPNGQHRVYTSLVPANTTIPKGNINVFMRLNDIVLGDYYTAVDISFDKESKLGVAEQIATQASLTYEDYSFHSDGVAFPLSVNHALIDEHKNARRLLKIAIPQIIKRASVINLTQPNEYFAGVVALEFSVGGYPEDPPFINNRCAKEITEATQAQ